MSTMHDFDKNVFFQMVKPPTSVIATATLPATYIDVSEYDYFAFVTMVGSTFDRTTYTQQLVQATSAAGAGKKNVTGALTPTPSAASKMVAIVARGSALDTANNFRYVAVDHTSSGGSADVGAILFIGWRARRLPVTQSDLESIVRV